MKNTSRQVAIVLCAIWNFQATIAEDNAADREFFEQRIRPALVKHCYECHSAGSSSLEGGLQLDFRDGLLKGGDSGAAIVPGKPEESLLLDALRFESLEMPPTGKLPEEVIRDFESWIQRGAYDPREVPPSAADSTEEAWKAKLAERSRWWSLQPPQQYEPPLIDDADWLVEPVDRFVRDKIDAAKLEPAPVAAPEVLLRRLSFVLTGLPPEPEWIPEFQSRWREDPDLALQEIVDRLLDSPHFGERFARHWMDVVRYTDTYGYEWDIPAKGSWEYRDYLIRAFNSDIGFDQIIREHIAGDLVPVPRINQQEQLNESLIGPMFFHLGERRHGSSLAFNGIHQEMVDSQIDAFSKAFLGMTVACTRCHDHKLDAISQRDYYALAGVFMTPRWTSRNIDAPGKYDQQVGELKQLRSKIQTELGRVWLSEIREGALQRDSLTSWAVNNQSSDSVLRPISELLQREHWIDTSHVQAEASNQETKLAVEGDQRTILASGTVPQTDTYKVRFTTPPGDVSLLRLEALTHDSLGSSGPGRTAHGNFVLSHIKIQVKPTDASEPRVIKLRSAQADYEQPNYPVAAALDPSSKGWGVGLGGNVHRTARFYFGDTVTLTDGGDWEVTLDFQLGGGHTLGRFRLTPGIEAPAESIPDDVATRRWEELAQTWQTTREDRLRRNESFTFLTDFSEPGFPDGWVTEGAGIEHGYVRDGTALIALEGESVVSQVLQRGYHTHALSSKLPGAVRAPAPTHLPREKARVKIAGGEWAGRSAVPQNAFLNEGPVFFDPNKSSEWMPVDTPELTNGVTRVLTDFVTASLHPNFPPRTGVARMGSKVLPNDDMGFDKRSWFSLVGIVADDSGAAPVDTLEAYASLYGGSTPNNATEVWRRCEGWLQGVVTRFANGTSESGDTEILNDLLANGLLSNSVNGSPELAHLMDRYRKVEATIGFPRTVNGMDERGVDPVDYRLNERGDVYREGPAVPRDFLGVFAGQHGVEQATGSGRLELANYLASRGNPQTARVYVNRVWQWIFGTGIVSTPNDFGKLGGRPSHPELLDWLAIRFMEENWSTKRLVRKLVLSQSFRQSGSVSAAAREVDPDNRLLHHYPTRRLEAEAIRDNLLMVSGRLNSTLYGHPIRPNRSAEDSQKRLFSGPLDGHGRRSIYLEMSVMQPPEFLVGFNLPDLKLPTGRRDVTNVPAQALILMNNEFVTEMSRHWADHLLQDSASNPGERISSMFLAALGRRPTPNEQERWLAALREFSMSQEQLLMDRDAWSTLAHALFNTKEFLYYR